MKKKLLILALILFSVCKPKKKLGIPDEAWREESKIIAVSICEKVLDCSKDFQKKLTPAKEKFLLEKLSKVNCIEKHKKSSIYLLQVQDTEKAKSEFRNCGEKIKSSSCEFLQSKGIQKEESCTYIRGLQRQDD
ncbi:MAG: hypothetical protein SFU98_20245 [Leptospiraceae bacterium]|nr:hypothetical protein [Leptospiraceae bacterium]